MSRVGAPDRCANPGPGSSGLFGHRKVGTSVQALPFLIVAALLAGAVVLVLVRSFKTIGPTEVGLVTKRFGRRLAEDNVIAMNGEAGFQLELLMPGLRFKLWPVFSIAKYPWVQVPAGEIGLVIAQVGAPLPVGAKSARLRRRSSATSATSRRSCEAAARRASSGRCCLPARWRRSIPSRSS